MAATLHTRQRLWLISLSVLSLSLLVHFHKKKNKEPINPFIHSFNARRMRARSVQKTKQKHRNCYFSCPVLERHRTRLERTVLFVSQAYKVFFHLFLKKERERCIASIHQPQNPKKRNESKTAVALLSRSRASIYLSIYLSMQATRVESSL